MAVVVKSGPEAAPRNPVQQLAVGSWLGGLFLLASVGFILGQLPILWNDVLEVPALLGGNEFLSAALLLLTTGLAIAGLVAVAFKLEGPSPQPGLRAGAFVAAALFFLSALIALWVTNGLKANQEDLSNPVMLGVFVAVAGALIGGTCWLFLRPAFSAWLVRFENQGWFHATAYKGNQGLRVRRGTLVGLLVLGGCGIYVAVEHGTLGRDHWYLDLPFSDTSGLWLLFNVNYTAPLILAVLMLWVSWRVINWPAFADFLIATEAEMNKVSWTTRRRLIQDTIVVLVAVFLMAGFLFVVDIIWIQVLSNKWVNVLQVDLRGERLKQQGPSEW